MIIWIKIGTVRRGFSSYEAAIEHLQREKSDKEKQAATNPYGLSDFERLVYESVLGEDASKRISLEELARQHKVHAASPRGALVSALQKMGLKTQDYPEVFTTYAVAHAAQEQKEEREQEREFHASKKLDDTSSTFKQLFLVAFVDYRLDMATITVLNKLEQGRLFPKWLEEDLNRWNSIRATERIGRIRYARNRLLVMRTQYASKKELLLASGQKEREFDCPLCAGIADRRPIPGYCAVCKQDGVEEVLELDSSLISSAGMLVNS